MTTNPGIGVGFNPAGGLAPPTGTGASASSPAPTGPVAGGSSPGAGMMVPTGPAAKAYAYAAVGDTAPRSPNGPTRFQDAIVHWAVLQRLDSVPEITTMPDEETARQRYAEVGELARQQAPGEPHRWPQLLSGRITWTEVR